MSLSFRWFVVGFLLHPVDARVFPLEPALREDRLRHGEEHEVDVGEEDLVEDALERHVRGFRAVEDELEAKVEPARGLELPQGRVPEGEPEEDRREKRSLVVARPAAAKAIAVAFLGQYPGNAGTVQKGEEPAQNRLLLLV